MARVRNYLDALGGEIVFGAVYGYSQSKDGRQSVTIGEAVRQTPTGITLNVISRYAAYGGNERSREVDCKATVTVHAFLLFPVDITKMAS